MGEQPVRRGSGPWASFGASGATGSTSWTSPRLLPPGPKRSSTFSVSVAQRGEYGLVFRNETITHPTPLIMHNKLRLSYKERFSEFETPVPPGANFAQNGLNSGVQDLVYLDLKVRSEHRLCGKQYDAEMQLYYLHNYGNMEATAVLTDAVGSKHNAHFQVLVEFFQRKFDGDRAACGRRRRRRRAAVSTLSLPGDNRACS